MILVVTALTHECTLEVKAKTRRRQVFYLLCESLGIQEMWYFGLMYYEKENEIWVDQSKKTMKDLLKKNTKLYFKVKNYPKDAGKELIETTAIEFMFLQVESSIVKDEIFCPADTCVLLASYALQAKYGDYNSYEHNEDTLAKHKLLPERLTKQHSTNMYDWHRDIIKMWAKHNRLDKEQAMLEYLKLAQKLDMYGVRYFPVKDKHKTDILFGVTTNGISIYTEDNRLKPTMSFAWSEIQNMTFVGNKFLLKFNDKSAKEFSVSTQSVTTCKSILKLSMGGHFLHIRRTSPELPEFAKIREDARRAGRNKNFNFLK